VCYTDHYEEGSAQQVNSGCVLNGVCYIDQYAEDTAQHVESAILC